MYGSGTYADEPYGGQESGQETPALLVPVIAAPFTVYAPTATLLGEQSIEPPLVTSAFQVFPPAAVTTRGRPIAEDIRIMRVRRSE